MASFDLPVGAGRSDEEYRQDDSSFNFRVNSNLKEDFAQLCQKDRMSVANALKRYMLYSVKSSSIKPW